MDMQARDAEGVSIYFVKGVYNSVSFRLEFAALLALWLLAALGGIYLLISSL